VGFWAADASVTWDVVVIGGGATGLGTAVDAATRGFGTLLLERDDFAKGTSSRSTKLIHGGVRYLRQGHIGLVREALHERGLLRKLAPHLVSDLGFVVPVYDWWEGPFYGLGFKLYDALAGDLGLGPSRNLTKAEVLERLPTISQQGLRGGVIYHDAQFDDARFAAALARTLHAAGGVPLNYAPVTRLLKEGGRVCGVVLRDALGGAAAMPVRARVVINATGVFCDAVRRLDRRDASPLVTVSQGVHLVLPRAFLPGDSAIMVPHTEDGRVLFAVPWHGRVLLGTTDTPVARATAEPRPLKAEVDYLLRHAAHYLAQPPKRSDVLSAFAGLRPLFSAEGRGRTSSMSREHAIEVSPAGLVTIAGGKWTTYRRMGEDAIDRATAAAGLPARPCVTAEWPIDAQSAAHVAALVAERPAWGRPLHPGLPMTGADIVWAARGELAQTVEDALSRRTRALLLDARAAAEAAPAAARLLAAELGRDARWERAQVAAFRRLADRHLLRG
jgi:glycerol-3-phosphate dehydrogenase